MDFKELYRKSREYKDKHDYNTSLSLLRDASYRILEGEKIPIPNKEVKTFLEEVLDVEDWASNFYKGGLWTKELDAIATETNRVCLQIIRKYDIQDLKLRITFIRVVSSDEPDPIKKEALEKEWDELEDKLIALEESRKKL